MRILMIYNDYLQAGGERQSVLSEVDGLRTVGHDVHLHLESNDDISSASLMEKCRILGGKSHASIVELRLSALLRQYDPDIVHLQNIFPTLGAGAIEAVRRSGLPYVRHIRNYRTRCLSADMWRDGDCTACNVASRGWPGVFYGCYRNSRAQSLGALMYARTEAAVSAAYPPDGLIAVSAAMETILRPATEASGSRVYVKHNTVSRQPLGQGGSGFLFAGRLAAGKGWETVLDLAERLPAETFSVIGDGPERETFLNRSRLLSNVRWNGTVDHIEALAKMKRARAVIVPSRWQEPFGRVAAEALSVGTPSLVSAVGGLPEIVEDLPRWLVVPAGDIDAWVEAVRRLQQLPDSDYQTLRKRSYEVGRSNFSHDAGATALVDIYTDVLSRTPRRCRAAG